MPAPRETGYSELLGTRASPGRGAAGRAPCAGRQNPRGCFIHPPPGIFQPELPQAFAQSWKPRGPRKTGTAFCCNLQLSRFYFICCSL